MQIPLFFFICNTPLQPPPVLAASFLTSNSSAFHHFFIAGGPLVWVVLLPLSLVTINLIVQYSLMLRRRKMLPDETAQKITQFTNMDNLQELNAYVSGQDNFAGRVFTAGLSELAAGREAMENVVFETIDQEVTVYLRRLEWLNIIGNVAPMIGLFGTVWGMIDAFGGIVQAGGQPEPADLAGGISTALVTTWWGLVVAIPALTCAGYLRNRLDAIAADAAVMMEKVVRKMDK